ncbi:MAG: mechanosensitive ion channel family protein [Euryarchaeota archaeon]|nr:mechanosensitive ion channel family protein [Euryarchaeota archaeon]
MDDKLSKRISKLVARLTEYAIFLLGSYYGIYYVLKLDLNALIASLGIISIVVALASRQIIQNFISGILISIERPIRIGDWVEVGMPGISSSVQGISKVKDVTLTRTVLRNKNGRLFYIPNSTIISSSVINYTKSGFVELTIPLVIPYTYDSEKVKKIIKKEADMHPKILPNVHPEEKYIITKLFKLTNIKLYKNQVNMSSFEPNVLISDISDSKITLNIRIWIREIDKKDEIISELLETSLKKFKEEDLSLKNKESLNLNSELDVI